MNDGTNKILREIDIITLILLVFLYVSLAIFPEIAIAIFGKRGLLVSSYDSRLVFALMPLVLLSEYLWFSSDRNKYLMPLVLIAVALIPIYWILK